MAKPFWKRNTSKKAQTEIMRLAVLAGLDVKAVNILINTHWDIDDTIMSWVERRKTPPGDFAYAKEHGVMTDPYQLSHDDLIDRVVSCRGKIEPARVAGAFAASLATRRFDVRSTLGTYALCLHLAPHEYVRSGRACAVCGIKGEKPQTIDVNFERFARIFLGGTVHRDRMDYAVCDLEAFLEYDEPEATPDDWKLLDSVLGALRRLPRTARLGDLQKALTGLFPSDKHQRHVVLEVLGECGILRPKSKPSPVERFVTTKERDEDDITTDWRWPVAFWKGPDGVNEEAVAFWFPKLAR